MNICVKAALLPVPVMLAMGAVLFSLQGATPFVMGMASFLVVFVLVMMLTALINDLRDQKRMMARAAEEAEMWVNIATPYRARATVIDSQCSVVSKLANEHRDGRCNYRKLAREIDLLRKLIDGTENNDALSV